MTARRIRLGLLVVVLAGLLVYVLVSRSDYVRDRRMVAAWARFDELFEADTEHLEMMEHFRIATNLRDTLLQSGALKLKDYRLRPIDASSDEFKKMRAALDESGLPGERMLAGIQDPDVKQELIRNTEDSVARGVFGSPSFFVGDELFFGKDKLRDAEEEIEEQQRAIDSRAP